MLERLINFSLTQRVFVCIMGIVLMFSGLYAFHVLDVVAYPDPSPPMIEVITQYPGWSAEQIERAITLPIEIALQGMPGLTDIRSLSIFGLSDLKVYFQFGTDYFRDRQEILNRLQLITLPQNVQPTISPWSAIAEIYRYEVDGAGKSLTDLKTIQDWQIRREFKRVPGVIDVTTFGGTTKEFHVDLDPGRLLSYNVSLDQVIKALVQSNTDVGGNYLTMGAQSFNVRGMGLVKNLDDIADTVVSEKEGTPIFIRNLGQTSVGYRVRLGKVGINERDDVVEGVVLLQRGAQALPVLERVHKKVEELNKTRLPSGVAIKTFYDRTVLIHTTIETVVDILIAGVVLVSIILYVFLGHVRTAYPDHGGEHFLSYLAQAGAATDGSDACDAGSERGGPDDLFCDHYYCRGFHTSVHDDRCPRKNLRADVAHLWIGVDGRAPDGLHARPCLVRAAALQRGAREGYSPC